MTSEAGAPRITSVSNGPYRVSGGVPLRQADGSPVGEVAERLLLCRCGGSSNKPYCDRTHLTNGFDGTEAADHGKTETRRDVYEGDGIAIYDDRSICGHIGVCSDNLAKVFKLGKEPWIDATAERADAIARVIADCPSGALSFGLPSSEGPVEAEQEPGITASENGPYYVVGRIPVTSADGSTYEVRARVALCRCGGSANKPFCDGTHWKIGFQG